MIIEQVTPHTFISSDNEFLVSWLHQYGWRSTVPQHLGEHARLYRADVTVSIAMNGAVRFFGDTGDIRAAVVCLAGLLRENEVQP